MERDEENPKKLIFRIWKIKKARFYSRYFLMLWNLKNLQKVKNFAWQKFRLTNFRKFWSIRRKQWYLIQWDLILFLIKNSLRRFLADKNDIMIIRQVAEQAACFILLAKSAVCATICITLKNNGRLTEMVIEIDFNSDEAIYVQLMNQIIMGIATSRLQEEIRFRQFDSWRIQ